MLELDDAGLTVPRIYYHLKGVDRVAWVDVHHTAVGQAIEGEAPGEVGLVYLQSLRRPLRIVAGNLPAGVHLQTLLLRIEHQAATARALGGLLDV